MKIIVLNGSPKGQYSITLQTVRYLEILHPEHEFIVLDAGKRIRTYENDFSETGRQLEEADLILFCYPVYTFIVPSQLHRFIELIKENEIDLSGKYASQISTSKHFYDVTAHRFIEENCQDLGMKYLRGLSADMDDLTKKTGQKQARDFFDHLIWSMKHDLYEADDRKRSAARHIPVSPVPESEIPSFKKQKRRPGSVGKISIVADLDGEDLQLKDMIDAFQARTICDTELVNIHDFPFKGGCISCFNCAAKGECIYQDGFDSLLRERIQTGSAIVLAFTIKDHSMGYRFKLYDDRQFCNGHRTVTMGKPFGYLISGNLSEEPNLKMIIDARAEAGGNYLAGIATDENDPDAEIQKMAMNLDYAIQKNYTQPANFFGVGGMKIFRDLIWLMQGLMKADHKFYKAHGQYDFPQKKRPTMWAMYLVGGMMSSKTIKKKIGNKMNEGMLMPYKKVLEEAKKERTQM